MAADREQDRGMVNKMLSVDSDLVTSRSLSVLREKRGYRGRTENDVANRESELSPLAPSAFCLC